MSEFCSDCPISGICSGEIQKSHSVYVEYESRAVLGRGPIEAKYDGDVGVLLDEFGNPSEPLYFPANRTPEQMITMVDVCDGPVVESKGFIFKKDTIVDCSALGRFACNEPALITYISSSIA